jgi:AcrR family transcriptional regulator
MKDKALQISRAAEDLFMSRRYHEVTLDEVAARAGVGKGTIYRYFQDKEDLYLRTLLNGFDELVESLEEMAAEEGQAGDLLGLACHHISFVDRRRALFALLRSEELRKAKRERNLWPRFKERLRAIHRVYAGAIQRGIERGRYGPETDPELVATFLMGMLRAGGRGFDGGADDLARQAVAVLEKGIGTSPATD